MRALLASVALIASLACDSTVPARPSAYFTPDPRTSGSITGRVIVQGKLPPAKIISMEADPDCQDLHPARIRDTRIQTAKDGGLANVLVYLKSGVAKRNFMPAPSPVVLDQRGCQFVPRILSARTGQTIAVSNSDPVSHNIHPMPVNNRDWNQHQAPGSPQLERRFAHAEIMIPVKCNIHGWMKSYIGVLDHPYSAITAANGTFALTNVPPGNYEIAAWHEAWGETAQSITLPASQSVKIAFLFAAATVK